MAHSISWALFEYQIVMGPVASPPAAAVVAVLLVPVVVAVTRCLPSW